MLRADHDLVLAKVSNVRKCVATIRRLREAQAPPLERWVRDDLTVLNLQRAAQACLDLANHLITANDWELPRSARHAFQVLAENGFMDQTMLRVMVSVIGFRNIAVHDYAAIEAGVVEALASRRLGDVEKFADAVLVATAGTAEATER